VKLPPRPAGNIRSLRFRVGADLAKAKHASRGRPWAGAGHLQPRRALITLKEDLPNPHRLELYAVIDGGASQVAGAERNNSFLTFTMPEAVAYSSERHTLRPTDIIATESPQRTVTFQEGQTTEIVIEGRGTLRNRVVSKPVPGHTRCPARKVP
jgi:2-keto-4-pentenoate hydratase/2-oxohepta-3-ene-1,7-dioic acid hydratase in catechol pathway